MQKTIIEAPKKVPKLNFREFWQYRDLLLILAWRDIRVRYAQTIVGLLWAVINPLMTLAVLYFVFSVIVQVDTEGHNPLVFMMAGIVAWSYFSSLMSEAGNSLLSSENMIKKIYFPRLILPISKMLSGFVEFGVSILCLLFLMIFLGVLPSYNILFLPFFILLVLMAGVAAGIWISALTVRYRDFRFVTPFLLRLGLYASPVAYPASKVPDHLQVIYFLNPMAGVIEGFRWCVLGQGAFNPLIWISFILLVFLLFSGVFYFKKVEVVMADVM